MGMRRTQVEGVGLAFVLAMAGIGLSIIGIGIASKPSNLQYDSGTTYILFHNGTNWGTTASGNVNINVTFHKRFLNVPTISYVWTQIPILDQVYQINYQFVGSNSATWTAQPNAVTEIFGTKCCEIFANALNANNLYCALLVNVLSAGTATAFLRVQGSNDAINWVNIMPSTGDVSIASTGLQFSTDGFDQIAQTSQSGALFLRIVGYGGNGIVSPTFGLIFLECDTLGTGSSNTPAGVLDPNASPEVFFSISKSSFRMQTQMLAIQSNSVNASIMWNAVACSKPNTITC